MASLAEIQALVEQIKSDLPALVNRSKIAPKQVVIVNGLSDMSERLGLIQAGEFRTGNGNEPGFSFSGVRIGYPAFAYDGDVWHFAGVNDDVLQVGINALDGKLYFGAGTGILNSGGIELQASGLLVNSNGYKFVDADNPDNIMGGVYAIVRHDAINDLYVELRAQPEDGTLTTVTASIDSVSGGDAYSRLTADSGGYGGNASMLILLQNAAERKLYTTDVLDVDFGSADLNVDGTVTFNSTLYVDNTVTFGFALNVAGNVEFDGGTFNFNPSLASKNFVVYGIGDGVDNDPALWVDAANNRAAMGTDHYFGVGTGSSVLLNERGLDIDLIMDDAANNPILWINAGLSSVGIGGDGESGYKLKVTGDAKVTGTLTATTFSGAVSGPNLTAYTPTQSAGSGSSTFILYRAGYIDMGHFYYVTFTVGVSAVGTGAGAWRVTLPFTAANYDAVLAGREVLSTGKHVQGVVNVGQNFVDLIYYDNSSILATGVAIMVTGVIPK